MIPVKCPKDGTLHYADESHIGRTIRCRGCGAILKIEPQEEPPASEIQQEAVEGKAEPSVTGEPLPERKTNRALSEKVIPREYLLMGAGLGAIVFLLLIAFWPYNPPPASTQSPSAGNSPAVQETPSEPSPGVSGRTLEKRRAEVKPLETKPVPEGNPLRPLPPCAQGQGPLRPKTGERIVPDGVISGQSNIRVMNAGGLDAAVKLVDRVTGKTSRFVYVQAGHTFAMEGVEAGAYLLQFQFGRDWIPACHQFIRDSVYGEFTDPFVFLDDRIRFFTVTLSPLIGGKTRTRRIDSKRFLAGDQNAGASP